VHTSCQLSCRLVGSCVAQGAVSLLLRTRQGVKNLALREAERIQGKDFKHATRDLIGAAYPGYAAAVGQLLAPRARPQGPGRCSATTWSACPGEISAELAHE